MWKLSLCLQELFDRFAIIKVGPPHTFVSRGDGKGVNQNFFLKFPEVLWSFDNWFAHFSYVYNFLEFCSIPSIYADKTPSWPLPQLLHPPNLRPPLCHVILTSWQHHHPSALLSYHCAAVRSDKHSCWLIYMLGMQYLKTKKQIISSYLHLFLLWIANV